MYKKELNIGDTFGAWTVVNVLEERKYGYINYRVKCICGFESNLSGTYLRAMKSPCCRSCSAKKKVPKGNKNKFFRHGASIVGNPLRSTNKIWVMMKQRCNNTNCKDYKNYGARGIAYIDKWETFEGFFEDMGKRPDGFSLERINNNGNYSKENCKWASRKEQNNNRRDNTYFIIDNERVTRTQIQEKLGWTRSMYRRRQEKYGNQWIIDSYKKVL